MNLSLQIARFFAACFSRISPQNDVVKILKVWVFAPLENAKKYRKTTHVSKKQKEAKCTKNNYGICAKYEKKLMLWERT